VLIVQFLLSHLFQVFNLAWSIWLLAALLLSGARGLQSSQPTLPQLIKRAKPAVVTVDLLDEKKKFVESGSGFFISSDLVVTSRHIFFNAKQHNNPTPGKQKATTHFATIRTNDRALPREYRVNSVVFDDVDSDVIILQARIALLSELFIL